LSSFDWHSWRCYLALANLNKKILRAQRAVDKLVNKLFIARTTRCIKFKIFRLLVFNNPPARQLQLNNLATDEIVLAF
jgi:hypothetical protein